MRYLCALMCLLAFLTACAGQGGRVRTPGEVWGFCMATDRDLGTCSYQNEVCDSYKAVVAKDFDSVEACRKACYQVRKDFIHNEGAFGCTTVFKQSAPFCTSNCNARYGK